MGTDPVLGQEFAPKPSFFEHLPTTRVPPWLGRV
jgi:hypothetical protein